MTERIVEMKNIGPIVNTPRIPPINAMFLIFLFNATIPPNIVKTERTHSVMPQMVKPA